MDQSDFIATLKRVTDSLQNLALRYHLTGGLVSSYYGEPRLTQDIDIVVAMQPSNVQALTAELTPEFLVDENSIAKAVQSGQLFQGLDQETFLKVDFHVGGSVRGEFDRSVPVEIFPGVTVPIVSKCDAIVSKLLWIKMGSGKSRQDVMGMLRDPEPMDSKLLQSLAVEHDVAGILNEILAELQ